MFQASEVSTSLTASTGSGSAFFLSSSGPPPVLLIAKSRKKTKELSIKVKNVGKAHRGAGTYNSSHKIIHILVSGRSQETLPWEYFPPLLLSLRAGNSTPGDSLGV